MRAVLVVMVVGDKVGVGVIGTGTMVLVVGASVGVGADDDEEFSQKELHGSSIMSAPGAVEGAVASESSKSSSTGSGKSFSLLLVLEVADGVDGGRRQYQSASGAPFQSGVNQRAYSDPEPA